LLLLPFEKRAKDVIPRSAQRDEESAVNTKLDQQQIPLCGRMTSQQRIPRGARDDMRVARVNMRVALGMTS